MTPEEQKRFNEIEIRLRKLEDMVIRLDAIIELIYKMERRVEDLEKHDHETMNFIHSTCQLKDKEILNAREDAIEISVEHADKLHSQTLKIVAVMFSLFIGAVVYFNDANQEAITGIQKNSTQIDGIVHSIDKIDSKIDKIGEQLHQNNKTMGGN